MLRRFVETLRARLPSWPGKEEWPMGEKPKTHHLRGLVLAVLAILVLGGGLWALMAPGVDDDLSFVPARVTRGGAKSVDVAAGLIRREVDRGWTPNATLLSPVRLLDNTPNFQRGVAQAVSRYSTELRDRLARLRGLSAADKNAEDAAQILQTRPDLWYVNFTGGGGQMISSSTESAYRSAADKLLAYNSAVAAGQSVFDARADNLIDTLDRIAKDLGDSSAQVDGHLTARHWAFNTVGDDLFYRNKGKLYAYYLLVNALGDDFSVVIKDRNIGPIWAQMVASLREAAALDPLVVLDGSPSGTLWNNHLAFQGLYLLRARSQIAEMMDSLAK